LPKLFNHLDLISHFTTDIRHISAQDNVVAEMLSRVEVITAPVTHDALAAAQNDDEELRALLVSNISLQLDKRLVHGTSVELYCDTSAARPRPYVHLLSTVRYSITFTPGVTPESGKRPSSSTNVLSAQPFKKSAVLWPVLVTPAIALKILATPSLRFRIGKTNFYPSPENQFYVAAGNLFAGRIIKHIYYVNKLQALIHQNCGIY
jgi:hypothetical protein